MATFRPVDDVETIEMFNEILNKYYGDLVDAKVTINILYAHATKDDEGNIKGVALKHQGWPVAAIVKVNSVKDRVEGKCDATISIDGDEWPNRSNTEQKSIIDHEIFHILLCYDREGNLKLDSAKRPKLRLKQHDVQMGVFKTIAKRYAEKSLDTQNLTVAAGALKQLGLEGGETSRKKYVSKVTEEE